jgi:hypothetical protein
MLVIDRPGRTAAGDLRLSLARGGVYFCAGRLDGGLSFTRRWWRVRRDFTASRWWVILGPVDLMWTRRGNA